MNIKVIKEESAKENLFGVYLDDLLIKSFSFKKDVPEWDIYNEKINYNNAVEFAKAIELTQNKTIKTIVYEKETNRN